MNIPIDKKLTPLISIIIPVLNEEENVEILYEEMRNAVDRLGRPYEIIFVNDGSTDHTFERLKQIKEQERQEDQSLVCTRIIQFTRNFGQTAAMQAGFDQASGKVIVSLDGDLQNDPKDIPRLLNKLYEGYDMVCGWRKNRQDKTLTRILPSKVANWMIGKITGVPIHDNGCSLKAYNSSVIQSIRLYSDMHRFIPALSTMVGASVKEIVVNHRPRKYGKTKYGLSRIWKVLFDILTIKMLIHFYDRPMFWFAGLGFVFFLLGLVTGISTIYLLLTGKNLLVLGASSLLFFTLFGALLSWGLLAEFITRIENRSDIDSLSPIKSMSIE